MVRKILGCVWLYVNEFPSVKWVRGKIFSNKENAFNVFGCAMENKAEKISSVWLLRK